jgi:glutathione S-transferase
MALTLYTNPMSRGRIARWMLEEVGEPYEARILDYGPQMKGPEYLAINPMGKVPALVHDGTVVTENAAILSYMAEMFPQAGLMPEDRAGFYRWMFFGAGSLEYSIVNRSMGWEVEPEKRGRVGYGCFEDVVAALVGHLSDRTYFCDERFTVVDVFVGAQISWALRFGTLPEEPALVAYRDRLRDRPAAIRASEIDDRLVAERQAANG